MDVWDGSEGSPVVYHGRTLTSKLPLADALHAIKKYAFVASPYPVILSVEVHCDLQQQAIMAQQLKDILGDALVDKHLPSEEEKGPPQVLPSPEDLKHRFLLKAKNLFEVSKNEPIRARAVKVNEESESDTTTTTAESSDNDIKKGFKAVVRRIRDQPPSPGLLPAENSPQGTSLEKRKSASGSTKAPMSFELAALIVYTIGVKCRGFNKKEVYAPFHVLSLGENRASKTIKEAKSDVLDHTRTHLVRAYPAGKRITSSNFLPQHLWAVGMQMVAINWQTFGQSCGRKHLITRSDGDEQILGLKSMLLSSMLTADLATFSNLIFFAARMQRSKTRMCCLSRKSLLSTLRFVSAEETEIAAETSATDPISAAADAW